MDRNDPGDDDGGGGGVEAGASPSSLLPPSEPNDGEREEGGGGREPEIEITASAHESTVAVGNEKRDDDAGDDDREECAASTAAAAAEPKTMGSSLLLSAESLRKSDAVGSKRHPSARESVPDVMPVPFLTQLRHVLKKNVILIRRRPITSILMLISTALSALLSWPAGRDSTEDFPPLDDCGVVPEWYLDEVSEDDYERRYDVPATLNDSWRDGISTAVLALGPFVFAMGCFLIVHDEIQPTLLGVLRGLGMRDSAFWVGWTVPFAAMALVNGLIGAAAASAVPVHVYESTYFGGTFGSFFFLDLALASASLFLAAAAGTRRLASVWVFLVMILAVWVPALLSSTTNGVSGNDGGAYNVGFASAPTGMFWSYMETNGTKTVYDSTTGNATEVTCQQPIMSSEVGAMTEAQRELLTPSEYYYGCYMTASYASQVWSYSDGKAGLGLAALFLMPCFHFFGVWGNFLGYTSMPDRKFKSSHASLTMEELALQALPTAADASLTYPTTLYPPGSTLKSTSWSPDYNDYYYYDEDGNYRAKSNCPPDDGGSYPGTYPLCSSGGYCKYGADVSPTTSRSVYDAYGFLTCLWVLYGLLASYWAQVFPGGNGSPKKFWFPFTRAYWFGGGTAADGATTTREGEGEEGGATTTSSSRTTSLRASATDGGAVDIRDATKKFGDFAALKGVSFKMERGEVTALLGHNGAGKSTLSNILCCELLPTSGRVSVFGRSPLTDPHAVRNLVGVCKQDDFLWPDLSAREHLELFAGLRGVSPEAIPTVVQEWLESVDLSDVQLQHTASFSGGMKRRLSVALSTIGDRPFVVLDEPTTGMDPVSRRFVWRHIDEIKEGRVVLLTTHAMEEADLLSDAVVIMKKGKLAATGTPLQLKADHGSLMQFTALAHKDDVGEVEGAIRERFRDAEGLVRVAAGKSGNITVNIQKIARGGTDDEEGVSIEDLSDFVAWLESEESNVSEYGFSNSSLEEVFLNVTAASDEEDEDGKEGEGKGDESDDVDVCCPCWCKRCLARCLKGPCRCCCRPEPKPRLPAEDELRDTDGAASSSEEGEGDAPPAVPTADSIAEFKPNLNVRSQLRALMSFLYKRSWTGRPSVANWVLFSIFFLVTVLVGIALANGSATYVGLVVFTALLSVMLIGVVAPLYSDRALGLWHLMRTQGLLAKGYLLSLGLYALTLQFAYNFLTLSASYATPLFREPELCPEYSGGYYVHCDRGYGSVRKYYTYEAKVSYQSEEDVELYAMPSPGSYGLTFGAIAFFAFAFPGSALVSSYVPGNKIAIILVSLCVVACGVAPVGLVYRDTGGEQYPCREDVVSSSFCDAATTLSESTLSAGDDWLNCLGTQINEDKVVCIPAIASMLPQFGLFTQLAMNLIADIKFVSEPPDYVSRVLIPALESAGSDCSGDTCKFPYAYKLYGQSLGYAFLGAVLLLILGVTVATFVAFPRGWVLRFKNRAMHWTKAARNPRAALGGIGQKGKKASNEGATSSVKEENEEELEEVTQEREHVHNLVRPLLQQSEGNADVELGDNNDDGAMGPVIADHSKIPREDLPPLLMHKLTKIYPSLGGLPPKLALDSLDLHVPRGQVLGLLGKNGAGKTTALKILSATHDATSGLGLVAGYDVSSERIGVFERLGNCPQFDIVWRQQSVQRHLEFFALLKGLPRSKVKDAAHSIATAVGLGSDIVYNRAAGSLSGGMRRRLSIAISLIGAPSVLLLDEPSTGLDPSTRNSIWGLVNSFATPERAISITTHMMIEADTLCSRIAIMSRGKLKVVATQQHLKNNFGSGYLLQLNLVKNTAEDQECAMRFVKERVHPDAKLDAKQAKTLHLHLPKDINLREVFAALYSPESTTEGCINQFLLSQSSLEDVFIALGD